MGSDRISVKVVGWKDGEPVYECGPGTVQIGKGMFASAPVAGEPERAQNIIMDRWGRVRYSETPDGHVVLGSPPPRGPGERVG